MRVICHQCQILFEDQGAWELYSCRVHQSRLLDPSILVRLESPSQAAIAYLWTQRELHPHALLGEYRNDEDLPKAMFLYENAIIRAISS